MWNVRINVSDIQLLIQLVAKSFLPLLDCLGAFSVVILNGFVLSGQTFVRGCDCDAQKKRCENYYPICQQVPPWGIAATESHDVFLFSVM